MAQTKRKRRSKHRGTAAGTIESRGRTGRRPSDTERKSSRSETATARREARLNQPPTWRGAAQRAALATGIFFAAVVFLFRQPLAPSFSLAAFMLAIYIPMGYYTEQFMYRRRQQKLLLAQKDKKKAK